MQEISKVDSKASLKVALTEAYSGVTKVVMLGCGTVVRLDALKVAYLVEK